MIPMLAGLPQKHFSVILADPPWKFLSYGKHDFSKSPEAHYPTMTLAEIRDMPIGDIAAKDCHLVMWVTWPFLKHALSLVEAWGFDYKTGGAWAKQTSTGKHWQFGTGYIFRSASEPLIVASRGKPKWDSKSERNLWVAPVREHSRKPDEIHEMIERAVAGPKLELFGRARRYGWEVRGNDIDKFPITAPRDLADLLG